MPSSKAIPPLVVQSDFTAVLEVDHPAFSEARDALAPFAELVKAPERLHTWRISPLSVWNAASLGMNGDSMVETLSRYSRYPVPTNVTRDLKSWAARYGLLNLVRDPATGALRLIVTGELPREILDTADVRRWLGEPLPGGGWAVATEARGFIKRAMIHLGYPVVDTAGFTPGEPLKMSLRNESLAGAQFGLRGYQRLAIDGFYAGGGPEGGSGVIVLPCGAGKTIVGLATMARVGASTLILCTGNTAVRQWIEEILDKTTLSEDEIGAYDSHDRVIRPVTVTTYQMLTHRPARQGPFPHFSLFDKRNWGLIIYDEVHVLPAPIFQVTAGVQSRRRLGLTATLVREDDLQDEVFALIGPKRFDVPWKVLEGHGWIAKATCTEIRVPMSVEGWRAYAQENGQGRFRVAAENPAKITEIKRILARHPSVPALIIGLYLDQINDLAHQLGMPLLSGEVPEKKRQVLYAAFRRGEIPALVVSKVANYAVDLPDAALAIQVSGTFGSRQEEAQRLGRILRPKQGENHAWFYTLVTRDSVEEEFARKRQLFLVEQGYGYHLEERD